MAFSLQTTGEIAFGKVTCAVPLQQVFHISCGGSLTSPENYLPQIRLKFGELKKKKKVKSLVDQPHKLVLGVRPVQIWLLGNVLPNPILVLVSQACYLRDAMAAVGHKVDIVERPQRSPDHQSATGLSSVSSYIKRRGVPHKPVPENPPSRHQHLGILNYLI